MLKVPLHFFKDDVLIVGSSAGECCADDNDSFHCVSWPCLPYRPADPLRDSYFHSAALFFLIIDILTVLAVM